MNTELDPIALHQYLSWHAVVPAPRTILKACASCHLRHVMIVEADGRCSSETYWQRSSAAEPITPVG